MKTVAGAFGVVWLLIGVLNITGMPWNDWSEFALTLGLILNVLVFIIPGLALGSKLGEG